MHVCYQITQLGEGQFDHIQDEIAWPDAADRDIGELLRIATPLLAPGCV